jgi:SAM-dependent methyltransferase
MPQNYLELFVSEVVKTISNPLRLKNLLDKKKRYSWRMAFLPENQQNWKESSWKTWKVQDKEFNVRAYEKYEDYLRHQKSKLERIMLDWDNSWLKEYDQKYYLVLKERLTPHIQNKGLSVLCLAARIGTEVRSFIDLGCFAVGLDLNPGKENKYVVCGDFHDLQFADESIDIVFTNSLDHSLKPDKVISEAGRVLKPNGKMFLEVAVGAKEGQEAGDYEVFFWAEIEDVINFVEGYSFKHIHREQIKKPFNGGNFLIFEKNGQF